MATSYATYKKEITDYLKKNFDSNAKILDVGAGEGTYLPFLQDYFTDIEAVEVFKPNIDNFNLEQRYNKVYNINIVDFNYEFYDIIIFGDIIEHLEVKEAQKVLKYALNRCNEMVVAVPYLAPQGIEEGNVYEIHKQDDLTDEIMKERYPYLKCVYKNDLYGYYLKGEKMKNYIVKSLISFDDYEGLEVKPENPRIKRNINDIFNCTKERYEYLKENNAVELVGINKIEQPEKEPTKEIEDGTLEHPYKTIMPQPTKEVAKEEKPKKLKRKK